MKKLILVIFIFSCSLSPILGQKSHLSLVYDFDSEDFDYSVKGMVGTNDSLYIISTTPNGQGIFFRLNENGKGYQVIHEFDDINYAPSSLIANDTIIYGTTRFSENGGGTIFSYSLKKYSFQIVKDFSPSDVQEVQIKYITDSTLWLSSQWSFEDEGSIFTIDKEGSNFEKVYNDTNSEKGQNPVDFIFHLNKIYIACYNGGGTPYPDGVGGTVASGSFIRINSDGTGYEKIISGGDEVGTQPQSLLIRENKLIGLFAYSGSNYRLGGQFFRCELDGSAYDSLGALDNRALTKLLSTDSLIYGISSRNVFGINPFNGEIRIFNELLSDPNFGYDVVSNPALLNDHVYLSAQQGGPDDSGGTILKWLNEAPDVDEEVTEITEIIDANSGRVLSASLNLDLNEVFTDPEEDELSFSFEYEEDDVDLSEANGILTLKNKTSSLITIKVTASDGWTGYNSTTIRISPDKFITKIEDRSSKELVYPNPFYNTVKISGIISNDIDVLSPDGKINLSIPNPTKEIDLSTLNSGIYFIRVKQNGRTYLHKVVKL